MTTSQSTLAAQLDALNHDAPGRLGREVFDDFQAATRRLEATGIEDRVLAVGAAAPGFTLPDAAGRQVALSALLERGPLVLSFYRGGWCPYCNLELRALQQHLPAIEEAGATLAAISPELPDNSLATRERHALAFPVLSDTGNAVARAYGLVFQVEEVVRKRYAGLALDLTQVNGDDSWELPIPATFVLDGQGHVRWRHARADYSRRAEPAEIVAALQAL